MEQQHIARARQAYRAFHALSENGLTTDAFSTGYIALFHLGYALLNKNNLRLPDTPESLPVRLWSERARLALGDDTVRRVSRFKTLSENGNVEPISGIVPNDLILLNQIIHEFFRKNGISE